MVLVTVHDARVVALAEALAPYAWSQATPHMLARRVVGVLDRHWLLGQLPGPPTGVRLCDVDPADPSDERVAVLLAVLGALRWRTLTRVALCRRLVSGLESWWVGRRLADIESTWSLDGGA
jgi:hypothetical protein